MRPSNSLPAVLWSHREVVDPPAMPLVPAHHGGNHSSVQQTNQKQLALYAELSAECPSRDRSTARRGRMHAIVRPRLLGRLLRRIESRAVEIRFLSVEMLMLVTSR